ncbi:MAG: DUF3450 domain-containing protein [Verrucomicrobiae bacterium]|nr:DUF3450 domain-containing protein [Verrucomicrobiae bacterium]NNJ43385.1 DUF3450 family protein [Akkermansiaceae bacterium]
MKYPALLLLLVVSFTPWVSGQDEAEKSDAAIDPAVSRELIRQWVQTERVLSEEKSAWQVEKKRMQDLLDLYQKELTLLDEEMRQAGESVGLVDENKQKLESELAEFRKAHQLLRDAMVRLLPRVKVLMLRFPQPLLEEISADAQRLRSPSALENPRDVLQSIIAVLTASARFNRSITVDEDTREVSEGKRMTVDVLYLGLCRAYYTTAAGETAGIGVPGKAGWEWQPKPDLADEIRRTIAVYQKDKQPQLTKLPIKVEGSEKK